MKVTGPPDHDDKKVCVCVGGGVGSPGYFEKRSHWVEVRKGRVSISQLYGGDAKRPDVTAGVVGGVQLLLTCYHLPTEDEETAERSAEFLTVKSNMRPMDGSKETNASRTEAASMHQLPELQRKDVISYTAN